MSLLDDFLEPAPERALTVPLPSASAKLVRLRAMRDTDGGYELLNVLVRAARSMDKVACDENALRSERVQAARAAVLAANAALSYLVPRKARTVIKKGKVNVHVVDDRPKLGHLSDAQLQEIIRIAEAKDVTPAPEPAQD